MSVRTGTCLAALLLALATAGPASAGTIHRESSDGDLSNNRAAPTPVTLLRGGNDVFGVTGNTAGVADRDYFTFFVPADHALRSLIVLDSRLSAGGSAFLGLQSGGQVTVDPAAPDPGLLLGYSHFAPDDIGVDILPGIGVAAGAQGFTPPLPSGQYSVWVQDGHPAPSFYGLRFDVVAVPAPATALLTLTGLASLLALRARRQSPPRSPRVPRIEPLA